MPNRRAATLKRIGLALVLVAASAATLGADMDARLNMAIRLLDEIDGGLGSLATGDVASYNALSAKLTKAADMLKSTESSQHPDFTPSTQRWNALRQSMVETAQQWQTARQSAGNEEATSDATAADDRSSTKERTGSAVASVDADAILAKYRNGALPVLGENPSVAEVESWAARLVALQGSELQADLALLDSGPVNARGADRVKRWITGGFQQQIATRVQHRAEQTKGRVRDARMLAEMIMEIPDDDTMRIFNFADGENGDANQARLAAGLLAGQHLAVLARHFPDTADAALQQAGGVIDAASTRFASMREQAVQTGRELAQLPKRERARRPEFLRPIEQELYERGSYIGSISSDGTVYVENRDLGSITSDGRIWVRGDDAGSIEPNGEVWLRGRQLGSLEPNGEVWRDGDQLGLVEIGETGDVWIGGGRNARIEPFDGEWMRAAIVFYFRDVFAGR